MNPYKLREVYKQLTSQNSILKKYLKLGTRDIKQPDLPAFVEQKNMFNRFMRDNPRPDQIDRKDMAGGGMLVQPGFGGTRQGYAKPKKKINRDESYRKVVKDFVATSGPGTGKIFDDPAAIEIVKANLNKIKKQRNNKALFEWSEDSDWYRKLRKELNPNTKTGTNREYTNKLINQVVDEFFPGAYHGKNAIKNFRNDMVVKSFIQHLKSVGEFDGQEKFDPVLEQFKNPPKKGTPNNYESINKSWKAWRDGEFEVDGIDRAQLKKELKARGINYDETIGKWTASGAQLRGKDKIKELKTLNKLNRFTNKSAEEIRALFLKEHPNANFDLRVNELTQLKRNGVYVSGANTELAVTGIDKGDRAPWLKQAYGKQFAGNYSKIINAADKLNDPNYMNGKFYNPEKAKRLYNAADKFFGPTGIVRKSAVGEAEHALARSFDFLNPDRQLAINSIVDGDLNQFKKNLFDIPVKRYFDEYNKPETTKARKVELKNLIEQRKKVMNAITGGQKSGIVAGDIVSFRYGDKITATSSVKPIDTLFKEGKFNIDDYIERGNKYAEAFQAATKDIDVKKDFSTPISEKKLDDLVKKIGCPGLASGGRAGFDVGTNCQIKGAQMINSGMKNATPAQLKNFAAFANRARALGRGVMKFGIIPEAMYVAADATIRLTMGDKPTEALLRASNYVLPGDQTKLAEMMEATRLMNPETAAIIGRSIDYKNQLAKIQSLEDTRDNLENLSGGGEFDYIGDLNNDVRNVNNQIKQATDALNTKFKITDAEQIYANRMQDEIDDIRKSRSLTTKLKSMFRDVDPDSDVETLAAPEKTQEQLNLKMTPQLDRDLLLASEEEMIQAAKIAQLQGFDIPDDYYIKEKLKTKNLIQNMSLAELAAATSPELVYGASGTMGEPLFKGEVEKPQNIIGDMEREITGQTNVANPFDIDLSMIGSGLRGFSAAGGGIAKQAGVDSGPPPESGPNPQGLSYLMKRGKNI